MSELQTYGVYVNSEYTSNGETKYMTPRIGTAFRNDDRSFNIVLHALPLTDPHTGTAKLSMRLLKSKSNSSIPQNSYTLFDMPQEAR